MIEKRGEIDEPFVSDVIENPIVEVDKLSLYYGDTQALYLSLIHI